MNAYSLSDIYGVGASNTLTTTDQTIPTDTDNDYFDNQTVTDPKSGQKRITSPKALLGAVILFVVITVILHFID